MIAGQSPRTVITIAVALAGAVWLGAAVANGEMLLSATLVGTMALLVLTVVQPLPLESLLLGFILCGYIVGNRGFAQLHPPNLPLLPAEAALMICGTLMAVRAAQHRVLPFRRDALNLLVLLWIAVSSVRIYSDVRTYGVVAIRDYATVYYATFFFIGQHVGATEAGQRFIRKCLIGSCAALAFIYPLFVEFPDVFLGPLAINGTPLIFFKGDLAGTFLAVGSTLFYAQYETRRSPWSLIACLLLAGGTIWTNNRASMLGLMAATALLALARRWRFALFQAAAGFAAAVVILFVAFVRNEPWQETRLYGLYERSVSLFDPHGVRTYSAADAESKGDNNRFRLAWWRAVFTEAVTTAPLTGLGYGYDLADRFLQEYYPDSAEEFTARSPHNVVLTVFARTGLIGVLPFLGIALLIGRHTVVSARRAPEQAALWLVAVVVFVSACFGVVLEGPMGAVVFWTALGLANAAGKTDAPSDAEAAIAAGATPLKTASAR